MSLSQPEPGSLTADLAEQLAAAGDPSWRVRQAAVEGLLRQPGQDTLGWLLRVMREQHRNLGILNSLVQVLVHSGIDPLPPLLELLADADAELRSHAARTLGERGDRRAIGGLLTTLDDPDSNVRYHAIEALGKLRATEAVDALAAVAETREFSVAFPALEALQSIGDRRVAARLVPLLGDEILRAAVARALGQLGSETEVAPLVELLNQPGTPAAEIAQALTGLFEHYERTYHEGTLISDLARRTIGEAGARKLLAALQEARDAELRPLGLVLSWLDGPAVEQALACLLSRPTARKEALTALVRLGSRATKLLLDQLNAEDPETCRAAVVALGRVGDVQAIPALVRILTTDEELTAVAAGALAAIGGRSAFEPLLGLLGHPAATTRQAVVGALNSIGHPDMPERIVGLLIHGDPRVRESAVKIAGYFGYRECVDSLLACCTDPDIPVCCAAVEQLPHLEDERAVRILFEALRHEVPAVRAAAARGLAQVEDADGDSQSALLGVLQDPDPWVRYFAVRSLGRRHSSEALNALARLTADDPAPHVRAAAMGALGNIGGPRAVAILAPWAEAVEEDLARAAVAALGQIAHPDAVPPLLAALDSPEPARRIGAIQALAEHDSPQTVDALGRLAAQDAQPPVVQAAVQALGRLGTPEAVRLLLELAAVPASRECSVEVLARLGEEQVPWVANGLRHPQVPVRRAAVDALARMKCPRASELLSVALEDPDAAVRLETVTALGHLSNQQAERRLAALALTDPDPAVRQAAEAVRRREQA